MARSLARNSANSDDVEAIDQGHLRDLRGVVAVVGERVMRVGNADLGIGAVAGFARQLEGDDAGDIALEGQHLQVEHEPGVVGVGGRHARGAVEVGQRVVGGAGLGALNAAFHFADGVQILGDAGRDRPGRAGC